MSGAYQLNNFAFNEKNLRAFPRAAFADSVLRPTKYLLKYFYNKKPCEDKIQWIISYKNQFQIFRKIFIVTYFLAILNWDKVSTE